MNLRKCSKIVGSTKNIDIVLQIHIKQRGAESSKQAGGCLVIQESLCCMELKAQCHVHRNTPFELTLNQVRGQLLLHSLTIRLGQGPCFV